MDIQDYPSLSKDEFSEACHHLDRRYCQATLGPLRKQWKLRLCTALDQTFSLDGKYTTFLQIIRPLEDNTLPHDLSLDMSKFTISNSQEDTRIMADQEMIDNEDADEVCTWEIFFFPVWPTESPVPVVYQTLGRYTEDRRASWQWLCGV